MELLAPVGNMQSLVSAVSAGADAVYLGLDKLNARVKADNFNSDNIDKAVEYCHIRGVKVYATMNTIMKDSEIQDAVEILKTINNAKVDAVIIQDLGVLALARIYAPNIEFHASTQMGIHNTEGALLLKELGFSRVVLSRETSLKDIENIKKNCDIELEYFAHGALCVSFSGNCYFSSIATGNSGNRGRCLQLCRKRYEDTLSRKKGYLLSAKDQCMINELETLKNIVDSIKIEGRLRSPAYVYNTVSAYRFAIDNGRADNKFDYAMQVTFNRGNYTKGYIFGDDKNIIYDKLPSNKGYYAGNITNIEKFNDKYLLSFESDIELRDGMGCKIIKNGVEQSGFSIKLINGKILSDYAYDGNIHITSDDKIQECADDKIPINIKLIAKIGEKLKLEAVCKGIVAEEEGDYIVEAAANHPNTDEQLITQINKLGNTYYVSDKIILERDVNSYIPNSILNNLRRNMVASLTKTLLKRYNNNLKRINHNNNTINFKCNELNKVVVEIDSATHFNANKYVNLVDYVVSYENYSKIRMNTSKNKAIYLKLPKISYFNDMINIRKLIEKEISDRCNIAIFADNFYALELAWEYDLPVIIGFGMNISNSEALKIINAKNYCVNYELPKNEYPKNGILFAYGKVPVMTFAHCPVKNNTKCDCGECRYKEFAYTSEHGIFKIKRERIVNCIFTMYNCSVHNLIGEKNVVKYCDLTECEIPDKIIECALHDRAITINNQTKGNYDKKCLS